MAETSQPAGQAPPHWRRWIALAAIKLVVIVAVTVWAIYVYL